MVQPALFFEPGPFPGLPGPAVGPKGPKIIQKPGAGFIIVSSLRSAQLYAGRCCSHGHGGEALATATGVARTRSAHNHRLRHHAYDGASNPLFLRNRSGNRRCGGSKRHPPTGKPMEKVGGEAPPSFSIGFPVGGCRLDPKADDFRTDFSNMGS